MDANLAAAPPAVAQLPIPDRQLAGVLTMTPVPTVLVRLTGAHGHVVWHNVGAARVLGLSPVVSQPAVDRSLLELLQAGGGVRDLEVTALDGSLVPLRVHAFELTEPDGSQGLWALHLDERSELRRVAEDRDASEARFRVLADQAPIGILTSTAGVRLGFVNGTAATLLGRDPGELLTTGWTDAVEPDDLPGVLDALTSSLSGGVAGTLLRTADGERWLRLRTAPTTTPGHVAGFIATLEDVTSERAHEQELAYRATHDPLTGLANRAALRTHLDGLLAGSPTGVAAPHRRPFALLFLDLDDFKLVNDSLGHDAGDQLLLETAHRLQAALRGDDVLARFGGDEFVVLCSDVPSVDVATSLASRLLDRLAVPFQLRGRQVGISASIGVVPVPTDAHTTSDALLRDADLAMYRAKGEGRARVSVFDEQLRTRATRRLDIASDLRRSLADGELTLAYQPVYALADTPEGGCIVGAEALLRWHHADHAAVPIGEVITLAEESGLVADLGDWVLDAACADLSRWRAELDGALGWVSVNVSALQLAVCDFDEVAVATVQRHGLRPHDVCLELTEGTLLGPDHEGRAVLERLRERGFRIAIDDFGTGWSSLAYLKHMPMDVLKIAAPFVAGLAHDHRDAAIAAAVVDLAAAIDVTVIAEGVETEAQRSMLRGLGCQYAQGYGLARPMPAVALTALLRTGCEEGPG